MVEWESCLVGVEGVCPSFLSLQLTQLWNLEAKSVNFFFFFADHSNKSDYKILLPIWFFMVQENTAISNSRETSTEIMKA